MRWHFDDVALPHKQMTWQKDDMAMPCHLPMWNFELTHRYLSEVVMRWQATSRAMHANIDTKT